jgi:mRNA capping enzyme, beta chain
LNDLVGKIHNDPSRTPLLYTHPHEADEFFELTPDGRLELPPSITQWIDKRHPKPKVRITTDLKTNTKKAQIIKSRIADLEIHNPRCSFDFRISINIESPWEGRIDHLIPTGDGSNDRMKDRMSYRHGAYQIDLTQISYNDPKKPQQHELEVEISTELVRKELDNLKAQRPTRYEELVRGFIDNVRILCRMATLHPIR